MEKPACLNCGKPFTADARNARHQRYWTAAACKAASKWNSQAKWLAKPENQDYHRGPESVVRVKAWRVLLMYPLLLSVLELSTFDPSRKC